MVVSGYEVGKLIGESARQRIYLASRGEDSAIMKVAKTFDDGVSLSMEASWFTHVAAFLKEADKVCIEGGLPLAHYDWLFARLKRSFMEPTQGDRRIVILDAIDVDISKCIPLPKLCAEVEVDARSNVWILGRLLKLYSFYELIAESVDNPVVNYAIFSPDDYLVEPEHHRVIYYNHSGSLDDLTGHAYVKVIAQCMLDWLAASSDPKEQQYFQLLEDFAQLGRISCAVAHKELYELVRQLWGRKYYPFTYRARGAKNWKNIQEDKVDG